MARFSQESIERVKDAADIVEIVSAYTELRRSGQRFQGLCPFHDERTPSFSVNAGEKVYHCFGCGVGGDVITFVEEKEGLPFSEAVEALADRYGVEVEREQEDPRAEEARKREAHLRELLDRTAAFYVAYLWEAKEARKALDYLRGRGLGDETLRTFGVGFAPNKWDTIVVRGQRNGFTLPELIDSGLVKKTSKGSLLDHFRARIMFPIRDHRGRIQGFGGRATRQEQRAKYVNSPDSKLFNKSDALFGIDVARGAITKSLRAVVAEGYTDVLALHQAGVGEAVAVMGTAITQKQVQRLSGFTDDVVLALDADRAGREAMLRGQGVAAGKGVRLRVASIPEGHDPADMLAGAAPGTDVASNFVSLINDAVELPTFHVRMLLNDADLDSARGRGNALTEIVEVLALLNDQIMRDELVREVSGRLNLEVELVTTRIAAAKAKRGGEPGRQGATPSIEGTSTERPTLSAHELHEQALLAMCIAAPAHGREYLERLGPDQLSSPGMVRVRDWLAAHLEHPGEGLPRDDAELADTVTQLVVRAQREPATPEAMELNFLLLEKSGVERQIAAAEANGGDPPVELHKRRAELAEQIAHHQYVAPKSRK